MKEKIKNFLANAVNPRIIVYEAGLPTGRMKTKGYGNPGYISVFLIDDGFINASSKRKYVELEYFGTVRRDFGTIRGNYTKVKEEARRSAENWKKQLFN